MHFFFYQYQVFQPSRKYTTQVIFLYYSYLSSKVALIRYNRIYLLFIPLCIPISYGFCVTFVFIINDMCLHIYVIVQYHLSLTSAVLTHGNAGQLPGGPMLIYVCCVWHVFMLKHGFSWKYQYNKYTKKKRISCFMYFNTCTLNPNFSVTLIDID
jgi:hypothetical protein